VENGSATCADTIQPPDQLQFSGCLSSPSGRAWVKDLIVKRCMSSIYRANHRIRPNQHRPYFVAVSEAIVRSIMPRRARRVGKSPCYCPNTMDSVNAVGLGQSAPFFRAAMGSGCDHSANSRAACCHTKAGCDGTTSCPGWPSEPGFRSLQLNFELTVALFGHD